MSNAARHPTMADVAARAGVSVSTVSRTLRGLDTVSPTARARVEAAARELSFVVSRQAASLVTGKTGTVGLLSSNLASWFTGSVLTAASAEVRATGRELSLYPVTDLAARADFFDRLPARRNADALLVVSFDLTDDEFARLDDLDVPVVYVSQHAPGRASVYVDDVGAAGRATRYLLNLGHRRIAYLRGGGLGGFSFSSRRRFDGFRAALAEAGLEPDDELVRTARHDVRSMTEAVGALLSAADPPTALFAETDEQAARVIWLLRGMGVAVPGRLSVLGFDDHETAEWLDLATTAQDPMAIGREAGRLACSLIDDPEREAGRHVVLPTRLVPRGSAGPPPPGPDPAS